ncbi:MAG: metallophosphoesterase [Acidimicrobiales bacterium]
MVDRSDASELWLDYVADLGDGWMPTYTVARLIAREGLALEWDGRTIATERGRLLVMGGDQAYPVPKRSEYEDRLLGPYRAALPCVPGEPPELFAVPGSHDWYDGLLNFISVFCRGHWIGGWRTRQSRSYFSVKLPHGWWLWGIDIQFGAYIDDAQLTYFSAVASDHVQRGDRIILCLSKEVASGAEKAELYTERNLAYFQREIIEPTGAQVMVYLKSGRHHYCRYQEEDGPHQHITAGGGGAFLHPTHHLPEHLDLADKGQTSPYRRAAVYPSLDTSKRLRKRLWLLPLRNLPFTAVLGGVHVLLALTLGLQLRGGYVSLELDDLWWALWESPTAVMLMVLMLLLLGAMVRFAHDARGLTRLLLGSVHSGLQLAATAGFMVAASRLTGALPVQGPAALATFLGLLGALGGLGGSLGMAGYLWATNCLGFHGNEAYALLRVMDYKHFLRLHIDRDGGLTLFPIGMERVCRSWRLSPDGPPHAPWFDPAEAEPAVHLVEGPVRVGG